MNTKIIIVLSIAAVLIVFSTNVLPDLIEDDSEKLQNDYHYDTTFPVGRPTDSQENEKDEIP